MAMPTSPNASAAPPPSTRGSPRLSELNPYTLPVCHDPVFKELLAATAHGPPSLCVRRSSDTHPLTEKDFANLDCSTWSKPMYIIDRDTESITPDGLVRCDYLIVGVAHAVQSTNKAAGGTKAQRFTAFGKRVTSILTSLRFAIWAGGATRGQSATRRKMKNPGPESWEKILLAVMDNLAPERDDDEETGGGTSLRVAIISDSCF